MNHHSNNTNALLVEIMVAVLFFALCATVLLQTITGVYKQSRLAGTQTVAMTEARDVLEQLNASAGSEETLAACGFTKGSDGTWTLTREGSVFTVTLTRETAEGGILVSSGIHAVSTAGDDMFTLEGGRYLPGEVD